MAYTYDDFQRAGQKARMLDRFRPEEMELIQRSPEYGIAMLSLYGDADRATTPEQRLLANESMSQLRSSYGVPAPAPRTAPTASPYIRALQGSQYNPTSDPVYTAMAKEAVKQRDAATANTLATAAGMTGGVPSSYAVTAAQQAADTVDHRLNAQIPGLAQNAYQQALQMQQMQMREEENRKRQEELEWQRRLQMAQLQAQNLDYSGLKALGVDTSNMEAALAARQAGGSGGSGGGEDYVTVEDNSGTPAAIQPISGEVVSGLLDAYPTGQIPDADWETLAAAYGEEALADLGFSKGSPKRKPREEHRQNGVMDQIRQEW